MRRLLGVLPVVLLLIPQPPAAEPAGGRFAPGKAGFAVRVRDLVIPYESFTVSVMPEATLTVSVERPPRGASFTAKFSSGRVAATGPTRWTWRAPAAPGQHGATIRRAGDDRAISLNIFVMHPLSEVKNGFLNGYRIGSYPDKPLRGMPIYGKPNGFIEVTAENVDTQVSPHFTLKQFLCKQEGGWPKYVILRGHLLLLLEWLLQEVNVRGIRTDTFTVMSGFRTPWYNDAIRNVLYSRHQWGGAVDIFIDENPRDGIMDDLNGDGRIDRTDADFLYDMVERLRGMRENAIYEGGLGGYGSTDAHGPFVHVDARGFRARWGR